MTQNRHDETALVPATPGALVVPDWMKDDQEALSTNEDFDRSEIRLPQLKVCQSMTPQRKRTDPNYIDGLQEGDLFNDASGRIYGTGPVPFVKLKFWPNYIRQKPLDQGGGMICRAPGGNCACNADLEAGRPVRGAQWGSKGEKPECTKFFNYLFYLLDTQEILWFSAKSTFIKRMQAFNTALRATTGVADFAKVFTFSTTPAKNAAGQEFYVPQIPRIQQGLVTNQSLYEYLKHQALDYADKTIDTSAAEVIDEEDELTDEKIPF
jgi:hypothetical protein